MDQLLSYGAFDFFQSKTAVNTGELGDSGLRAQFTYLQKRRDGYADNLEVALPVLQRFDVPATVFVAPGFLDGGLMFNDAITEIFRQAPAGWFDLQPFGLGGWQLAGVRPGPGDPDGGLGDCKTRIRTRTLGLVS